MASKVTRDDAALLDGTSLATLLSPLYFTIEQYHQNADLVVMGEDMQRFALLASEVNFIACLRNQPFEHFAPPGLLNFNFS